jgi:hypothetical protein
LKELYLDSNSIVGEGARALAGALPSATALTTLSLHSNDIADDEAEAELRRAGEGRSLKFQCITAYDASARALLAGCPSVQKEK